MLRVHRGNAVAALDEEGVVAGADAGAAAGQLVAQRHGGCALHVEHAITCDHPGRLVDAAAVDEAGEVVGCPGARVPHQSILEGGHARGGSLLVALHHPAASQLLWALRGAVEQLARHAASHLAGLGQDLLARRGGQHLERLLVQDGARVQLGRQLVQRHPQFGPAVVQGPEQRRGATQFGKQRRVRVDAAQARDGEHLGREDAVETEADDQVQVSALEGGQGARTVHVVGQEGRNVVLQGLLDDAGHAQRGAVFAQSGVRRGSGALRERGPGQRRRESGGAWRHGARGGTGPAVGRFRASPQPIQQEHDLPRVRQSRTAQQLRQGGAREGSFLAKDTDTEHG
mmetsp:Transcript_24318/g.78102  ORF Transcript_24318/g.78102 Transcript_24318/m.78102 type:complete len:343 (-) Transcript_24318:173-1201(-)